MLIPSYAVELAKRYEGFHRRVVLQGRVMAKPYLCPANFWTIGYGHLTSKDQAPITAQEAEKLLKEDLWEALYQTIRLCPILLFESDARLAAIVDFTFNLGASRLAASTLRRKINAGDWKGAAVELRKWVWGGGRKLPGLILRREAEVELLLK
jgi:lysozyme